MNHIKPIKYGIYNLTYPLLEIFGAFRQVSSVTMPALLLLQLAETPQKFLRI